MKKKLTSAKTANDPNSRINKSLESMELLNGNDVMEYRSQCDSGVHGVYA
jgi:hypothetical protein